MLARGATTFWESFDPAEDGQAALDFYGRRYGVSRCHGWSGAIAGTLAHHVLGVQILEPGGRRVALRPRLGPLASVEGTVPTPLGPVDAVWSRDRARIAIPPGMRAEVAWADRHVTLGPGVHVLA
jgi:hypothetical protein